MKKDLISLIKPLKTFLANCNREISNTTSKFRVGGDVFVVCGWCLEAAEDAAGIVN